MFRGDPEEILGETERAVIIHSEFLISGGPKPIKIMPFCERVLDEKIAYYIQSFFSRTVQIGQSEMAL